MLLCVVSVGLRYGVYLRKMVCARHKYCGGILGCRIKCYIRVAFGCNFDLCTPLYTIVHPCALLYTIVHPCTLLYTLVHYCTPLYTIVHPCALLYTLVHYCTPLYTIVHSDTLEQIILTPLSLCSASLKHVKSLKQQA